MPARDLGRPGGNPLARPRQAGGSRGEVLFAMPGTYIWICPPGVTKVCAVGVGPGGPGYADGNTPTYYGGGGGALRWANEIPVVPGQAYTIVVGAVGYITNPSNGGLVASADTTGLGITAGCGSAFATGGVGSFSGVASATGGGNGGNGSVGGNVGGGGAGGYSGNGSPGTSTGPGTAATGGAGSGGWSASGGGVGIYGEGASGVAAANQEKGRGGSGGTDGHDYLTSNYPYPKFGSATYGGGGGNRSSITANGPGAFRILWGAGRAFPSTDVGPS